MTAFGAVMADCATGSSARRSIRVGGLSRSWAECIDRAMRLAGGMVAFGITSYDTVALYMDTSHDAIEAWFATSIIGCMEAPLNVEYQGELLRYLLVDSRATVLVCDAKLLDRALVAAAGTSVGTIMVSGELPDIGAYTHQFVLHRLADLRTADPVDPAAGHGEGGVILYTSGTTGPSKGVMHSQQSCLELARYNARMNSYGPDDTLLNFFPLYHQNARYTGVGAALASGAGIQLDRKFTSSRFWDVCRDGGITAFNYLGSVLDMIINASAGLDETEARNHSVTRAWGAGADHDAWQVFEQRFGVALNEVYGLTEAPMATINYGRFRAPRGSAGRESELFEVKTADDQGGLLGPGEVGEIVVRPKKPHGFMLGYLGRDEATVAATRNLWFHTGDAGWLSEDGCLYFKERTKDTVRRRGENISLWEVESALNRQPGVIQSAAYGVTTDGLDDEVMAAIVVSDEFVSAGDVLRAVRAELPGYAVPRYLRLVTELPHTQTMKIQKQLLRAEGITPDTVRFDDAYPTT